MSTVLKHVKGNLITLAEEGHFNVILHGCNCYNSMGKGIAKEIRERYPAAARADAATVAGDKTKLGNYTTMIGKQFNIVNAYTQFTYWNVGDKQGDLFEYDSFNTILNKLAEQYPTCKMGLPYIGMGLAGGDSTRIIAMIEQFATKLAVTGGTVTLVEFG
jgi:O-acetyl-ADP-ribose deacetylase (regulator of RNase III)